MAKHQTAVEYIEMMVKNMVYNGADFGDDYDALLIHIDRAKKREKDIIVTTYDISLPFISGEEYYNHMFKKENQ